MIEAPLALLQEEMEAGFRDAVISAQMALCLAPEVFDAVDVVTLIGEQLRVIDALMMEL